MPLHRFTIPWAVSVLMLMGLALPGARAQPAPPPATALTCLPTGPNPSFAALGRAIGAARVVMLGEQTHQDAATLETKVALVRYLHDSLGFTVLAFEADMYGADKANREIHAGQPALPALQSFLYNKRIWSGTAEFQPLAPYLAAHPALQLAGFDSQLRSEYTEDEALPELRQLLALDRRTRWRPEEHFLADELLGQTMNSGDFRQLRQSPTDSVRWRQWRQKTHRALANVAARVPAQAGRAAFWQQWLRNWAAEVADHCRYFTHGQGDPLVRDQLMAANLLYLARQQYPAEKIIVWAASSHIADHYELISRSDTVAARYLRRQMQLLPPDDLPSDTMTLRGVLGRFEPMGKQVRAGLGAGQVFSLAFTAYEGRYGMTDRPREQQPVLHPPAGSLERAFVVQGCTLGFADLRRTPAARYYAAPLGYLPLLAPWGQLFDGMIFTRTMRPVVPLAATEGAAVAVAPGRRLPGRLLDAQTGAPVSFASVGLRGTTLGTVSNTEGNFLLFIPADQATHDTVQVSCLGYGSVRLPLARLAADKELVVKLKPQAHLLGEVLVKAPMSAAAMVAKAREQLATNYPQAAHSMQFFYRFKDILGDSVRCREEAAVDFYDATGYRRGSWERGADTRFTQVRQLRRHATGLYRQQEISDMWQIWARDPVLTTRNPLSEGPGSHFTFTRVGETEYNGRLIHEIRFECRKPNAFTTPYAYPSPASFEGRLFIDADNYAVVKYEAFTTWDTLRIKNKKVLRRFGFDGPVRESRRAYDVYQYEQTGGQYYLKYSRHYYPTDFVRVATGQKITHIEAYDLLTTSLELQRPVVLQQSLTHATGQVPYREEFWSNYQTLLAEETLIEPTWLTAPAPAAPPK